MIETEDRGRLLVFAAVAMTVATPASAQERSDGTDGLQEIVVTAQKRAQSLQDVPVAVTALTGETLAANRFANVTDLSGLAPGVTVRAAAGGSSIPSFTIRGSVSFGVVPGSDRQVSTYLDGVYLSAPRGATFDLPDVERIEVLRGPQGTLFGRNATAGAVSVTTRDPSGTIGAAGRLTVGNLDQRRVQIGLDTPQVGPFSAYVSYVHDYRRGDIRNVAAGQTWDRLSSPDPLAAKVRQSPQWLGTKKNDAVFAAVKLDLDDFVTTYKFDWTKSAGTPDGTAIIGISDRNDALSNFLRSLIATQPTPVNFASSARRPKATGNGYTIPIDQTNYGHNLTSTLNLARGLSLKNVFGYRRARIFSAQAIDGLSSLVLTAQAAPLLGYPQSLVGSPYVAFGTAVLVRNEQWSDELQLNYDSRFLTLTAGALWFKSTDKAGTNHVSSTIGFTAIPGGVVRVTTYSDTFNRSESTAAYAQGEFHLTPQLDLFGGIRITHDNKSGRFLIKTATDLYTPGFTYKDTRPSYALGVNFKPGREVLLYAKYSTAFVSGGSIAGIDFEPETAASWEGGVKAELLDRRLRTNLAAYTVKYRNLQTSQTAALVPGIPPYLGTFVLSQGGPVKASGFELEVTAAPTHGVTFGGSLSYTKTTATDVNPIIVAAAGGAFTPTLRPEWTGGLWGQIDTEPVVRNAYLSFRADGNWQSSMLLDPNPARSASWAPDFAKTRPYWIVNARTALRNIEIGGVKSEVAVWAKNLTDTREAVFGLNLNNVIAASSFVTARTYGVDLSIKF